MFLLPLCQLYVAVTRAERSIPSEVRARPPGCENQHHRYHDHRGRPHDPHTVAHPRAQARRPCAGRGAPYRGWLTHPIGALRRRSDAERRTDVRWAVAGPNPRAGTPSQSTIAIRTVGGVSGSRSSDARYRRHTWRPVERTELSVLGLSFVSFPCPVGAATPPLAASTPCQNGGDEHPFVVKGRGHDRRSRGRVGEVSPNRLPLTGLFGRADTLRIVELRVLERRGVPDRPSYSTVGSATEDLALRGSNSSRQASARLACLRIVQAVYLDRKRGESPRVGGSDSDRQRSSRRATCFRSPAEQSDARTVARRSKTTRTVMLDEITDDRLPAHRDPDGRGDSSG